MNPEEEKERLRWEGYGDSGVISIPAGFRRHLVGKTLINVYHCDIAEKRSVGKLVIIPTFLLNYRIEFYLYNTITLNSAHYAMIYPQNGDCIVAEDSVASTLNRMYSIQT